ncbi:GGDEF domain-containing protein [Massilia sp. IC2-477]|uniref:GGDEF domain-containing protein n=1 Tax=unclassified Massilia TaxID=2609279 RepID=UPI001D127A37|nr:MULTISPECIES: GGDEF domain-containing protein [unclassified Massilia]MCC2955085.1 GGDEF domain-containing protein [Massilia sp. IC2-477]MCC2973079.1 GGDEF domain-containing protein [Massilia sp. IC2-476]
MDSLLRHMVDMTGHRDHTMLDISVISAVQELAGAVQTRVLAIATVAGQKFVRSRACIRAGGVACPEEQDGAGPGEPITSFPELAHCLENHDSRAQGMGPDGLRRLWLPIWFGDKADTCLEITHEHGFTADSVHTISGIVSVYRNFQNLLDYSERDSLTGLLNRKTFDDQLARMLHGADAETLLPGRLERRQHVAEEKQWLAVVDVDHFKTVNDRFGHLYGDEVLILVANLLQTSFRSQDRVFRFGGEEFVVLLRSTTLENARKIIDRFRTNVESHVFPQVGQVTVSVGFTSISAADSPVVTLGHADQALYFAKANGRNRACHYEELVANGLLQTIATNDTAEFF